MRLAEISRRSSVSKATAVAALRGSDLIEFNETHRRDERGRFARVESKPSDLDPRIARMARLRRRQRRGAAEASAAPPPAALKERVLPLLETLRRERVLPQRQVQAVAPPKQKAKEEAKAPVKVTPKVKTDLNDESKGDPKEDMYVVKKPGFVIVDPQEAVELMLSKSFVVGAANDRWRTSETALTAFDWDSLGKHIADNDISGKVILEISNDWYTPEGHSMLDGVLLSSAQYLATDPNFLEDLQQVHSAPFVTPTGIYNMPVIPVNASDYGQAEFDLRDHPNYRPEPASKAAAWDEDDHLRDPDSGRFMRLHSGPGAPPSPSDPRIARERRRRRRIGRSVAEVSVGSPQAVADPRVTAEPVLVRADPRITERPDAERIALQRRNAEWLAHQSRRAEGLRLTKPETKPEVKPKPEPRVGPHRWASGPYVKEGIVYVPGAASEALPDIGKPSERAIRRERPVYDPIELDDEGKVVMPPISTPKQYVDPRIRPAFLQHRRDVIAAHRARKDRSARP